MSCRKKGPVALAVAFLCGCSNTGNPESTGAAADFQMSRSLVGTWSGEEGGNGAKAKVTRTYKPDGLFLGETSSAQASEESSKGPMTGTWLVENGVLTEKVQKGGQARTTKPAQTRKYQIVSVDDKVLKLKTEKGEESVLNRGPSPPSPR